MGLLWCKKGYRGILSMPGGQWCLFRGRGHLSSPCKEATEICPGYLECQRIKVFHTGPWIWWSWALLLPSLLSPLFLPAFPLFWNASPTSLPILTYLSKCQAVDLQPLTDTVSAKVQHTSSSITGPAVIHADMLYGTFAKVCSSGKLMYTIQDWALISNFWLLGPHHCYKVGGGEGMEKNKPTVENNIHILYLI